MLLSARPSPPQAQPIHEYEAKQAGAALARATLAVEEAQSAVARLTNVRPRLPLPSPALPSPARTARFPTTARLARPKACGDPCPRVSRTSRARPQEISSKEAEARERSQRLSEQEAMRHQMQASRERSLACDPPPLGRSAAGIHVQRTNECSSSLFLF